MGYYFGDIAFYHGCCDWVGWLLCHTELRSGFARDELHSLLGEDALKDATLLVLAKKQELPVKFDICRKFHV